MEDKAPSNKPAYAIRNQTAKRIGITSAGEGGQVKVIPPFGSITVTEKEHKSLRDDLDRGESWNLIEVDQIRDTEGIWLAALGFGVLVTFLGAVVWLIWRVFGGLIKRPPPGNFWLFVFVLLVVVAIIAGIVSSLRKGGWQGPIQMARWFRHSLSLLAVVLLAVGVPAFVILGFGDVADWTTVREALADGTTVPQAETDETTVRPALADGMLLLTALSKGVTVDVHLLGRALQLLFIGIFSSLPALLFFLFDRQRLSTVRESFFRSVMLLDARLLTLSDAKSAYGSQVDEVLGAAPEQGGSRLLGAKRTVILLATAVITIGWILCLSPIGSRPEELALSSYFVPDSTPVAFAFLGSYIFVVGLLFRLYVRSDLKPKAYAHVIVRVVTAIAFAWTLSALPMARNEQSGGSVLLLLAFTVGFFPTTGFIVIFQFLRNLPGIGKLPRPLDERFPLRMLDGVNIYHRARLLQEGVENMENLAHSDLVELMLNTSIPLPTLLDWVDQAILYLHLGETPRASSGGDGLSETIKTLRAYGIRTATDLQLAYDTALDRDNPGKDRSTYEIGDATSGFLSILKPEKAKPEQLQTIIDTIKDDEWMTHLKRYRDPERFTPGLIYELEPLILSIKSASARAQDKLREEQSAGVA